MSMDTSRKDMTQAVFEGVAFALRDCLEAGKKAGINVSKSGICGGGAKNTVWCKIVADILGITLEQTENTEGPSFGGAILAAVAKGEYASVQEAASKLIRIVKVTEPDPEKVALYNERYAEYSKIYPALKETYAFINERR
jgi:xylulokinase